MSIVDVARVAGVSTATVSRVINDFPGVRAETVAQVRQAIEQLNYDRSKRRRRRKNREQPSHAAIKRGSIAAFTLGESHNWLQLPVIAATLSGIQRGTAEYGLRLVLQEFPDLSAVDSIPGLSDLDGAIVFLGGSFSHSAYEAALRTLSSRLPIVWVMGQAWTVAGIDHIVPDNVGIGTLAYQRLARERREHVGFLSTDPRWSLMRQRGQAFLNAAADDGKRPVSYLVAPNREVVRSFGYEIVTAPTLDELIDAMLAHSPRPDGLFVANDLTTSQVYPILQRRGIKLQKDMFIVSCDNEDIRLSALSPRPPSVSIHSAEIGYRAVIRLLSRIQTPDDPTLIVQVAASLVEPAA